MIDRKLIVSRKINSVSLGAECMYIRILLLTDDFGRYHADPRILKAQAFSLRNVTNKTIWKWLTELIEIGLIKIYSSGIEKYLEVVRFEDFQTFRTDRKRRKEFPKPETYDDDIPVTYQCPSMVCPKLSKVKVSKENEEKEKKKQKEKEKILSCTDPKCQNLEHWECQFKHYWREFPKSWGRVDTHSLFLSLCRKGEIRKLIKALDGYIEYLNDKRINENFDQAPMNSARFLRKDNWREFIGFKMRKKL